MAQQWWKVSLASLPSVVKFVANMVILALRAYFNHNTCCMLRKWEVTEANPQCLFPTENSNISIFIENLSEFIIAMDTAKQEEDISATVEQVFLALSFNSFTRANLDIEIVTEQLGSVP
ncbi:hypothetical protein EDD17DRAFT_1507735 [Pisolithus thermaeus]|nr:hypothetical protein EV401DRAFT_1883099 [Pisolithus croceorrhizus]KAI6162879.1 hypothetical protein EDD17DRAFT_1507735 [Pisolithus thermaeus]